MWSGFFGGVVALACLPVQERELVRSQLRTARRLRVPGAAAILFYGGAQPRSPIPREVIRENKVNRSPFRAREGPDGTVALATVFSGRLDLGSAVSR